MHDMWYANTVDDVIYYNSINDNMVYSYNFDTNENHHITETACYYLATYQESIYCSDYDNAGYLTKIDVGTALKKSYSKMKSSICTSKQALYIMKR